MKFSEALLLSCLLACFPTLYRCTCSIRAIALEPIRPDIFMNTTIACMQTGRPQSNRSVKYTLGSGSLVPCRSNASKLLHVRNDTRYPHQGFSFPDGPVLLYPSFVRTLIQQGGLHSTRHLRKSLSFSQKRCGSKQQLIEGFEAGPLPSSSPLLTFGSLMRSPHVKC